MKTLSLLFMLILSLAVVAQVNIQSGLYCSKLEEGERWCFRFDTLGHVEAILSGKLPRKVFDGFLPSGFTTDYKIERDSIKFVCYSDEFGAEKFPKPYRFNYFTVWKDGDELSLVIDGYTSMGTIRQIIMRLKLTELGKPR